jgi:gliding motility-associated lipoprotein GldD
MKHRKTLSNWQFAIGRMRLCISSLQSPTFNHKLFVFLIAVVSFLASCNSDFVQKERGYFKIDLPQKKYQQFSRPDFPYTFEYPVYSEIIQDSLFFDEQAENPFWINVDFPQFNGRLHLSYKEIGKNKFDSLVNDAFTMSYKQHTSRASGIQSQPFETPNGIGGIYFTLKGNAATANQFFATDSVKHFLRGALYFNATPNEDSLRPVNNFLKDDMQHLINTLRWK